MKTGEEQGRWSLALHGGASSFPLGGKRAKMHSAKLEKALELGSEILKKGGSALDAVEQVVVYMENSPLFNAGKGAAPDAEGNYSLEASIMDGNGLRAGAVAGLSTVKNPIILARKVMEKSNDIVLISEGAEVFAKQQGVERVSPSYFKVGPEKHPCPKPIEPNKQWGTVGCVALDKKGCLAAATSTGGLEGKRKGRMTDSSTIGAGNYAKEGICAVSSTGKGNEFITHSVASRISCMMEYRGDTLQQATRSVIYDPSHRLRGGVIAVDCVGNVSMVFNTTGMLRAFETSQGDKCIRTLSSSSLKSSRPVNYW